MVEPVFVNIATVVCQQQQLIVAVNDASVQARVADHLQRANIPSDRYGLWMVPSNDTWARDHGPITVLEEGQPVLLDFCFTGWGGKFAADRDDALTSILHKQGVFGSVPLRRIPFVLEGGSIEVDGVGSLLTTASCLLTPTRNGTLDRLSIEAALRNHLGIERVLWLHHGHLAGDDTDGHIDTLARFCSSDTLAYQSCTNPTDEHFDSLHAMAEELAALRQPNGVPYRLVPLPWPNPKYASDGRRLPATYANFLIINHAVLVPTYEDPADETALALLQTCFPGRRTVGIPCLPLLQQNGSLHCLTMQLPAMNA